MVHELHVSITEPLINLRIDTVHHVCSNWREKNHSENKDVLSVEAEPTQWSNISQTSNHIQAWGNQTSEKRIAVFTSQPFIFTSLPFILTSQHLFSLPNTGCHFPTFVFSFQPWISLPNLDFHFPTFVPWNGVYHESICFNNFRPLVSLRPVYGLPQPTPKLIPAFYTGTSCFVVLVQHYLLILSGDGEPCYYDSNDVLTIVNRDRFVAGYVSNVWASRRLFAATFEPQYRATMWRRPQAGIPSRFANPVSYQVSCILTYHSLWLTLFDDSGDV